MGKVQGPGTVGRELSKGGAGSSSPPLCNSIKAQRRGLGGPGLGAPELQPASDLHKQAPSLASSLGMKWMADK